MDNHVNKGLTVVTLHESDQIKAKRKSSLLEN